MTLIRASLGAFAVALAFTSALGAQTPTNQPAPQPAAAAAPALPPAPAVGDVAPDFSLAYADANGPGSAPISLKDLRGKVVVLAFYPKDRTSGCTAELTKFRDENATLFGKSVVVLPISEDDVASHAGWAKDMHFPFALLADNAGAVATQYGSIVPGHATANRTVFVIGRDGKIKYSDMKFGALDQHAYDALAAAIKDAGAGS